MLSRLHTLLCVLLWLPVLGAAQGVEQRLADLAACEPGYALMLDGRTEEAIELLEAELARRPDSAAALVWLTRARVQAEGDPAHLEALARAARARSPSIPALTAWLVHASNSPGHAEHWGSGPRPGWNQLELLDPGNPFLALERARAACLGRSAPSEYRVIGGELFNFRRPRRVPEPKRASEWIAPYLIEAPGALAFWQLWLDQIAVGTPADVRRARAAATLLSDSPLAAELQLLCARWAEDPARREELLLAIEQGAPEGCYWDDARFERSGLVGQRDARSGAQLLEELVERGHGDRLDDARQNLLDWYLGELDEPARALELLPAVEAASRMPWHEQAAEALLALKRVPEARARAELWLATAPADPGLGRGWADARWTMSRVLTAEGEHAASLALFDELRANAPELSYAPWTGGMGTARWLLANARVFRLPALAAAAHLLLWALALAIALLALAARIRHLHVALPSAAALALIATLPTLASATLAAEPLSLPAAAYLVFVAVRNAVLAGGGALLLLGLGVKRSAWTRPRGPRRRRLLRAELREVALAVVVMYALTHLVWAIATPEPGPFFERMANLGTASEFSIFADVEGHRLEAALLASSAAVQEELVYRCAWLGAIAHATKRVLSRTASRVAAVSLSSLAWAFVHAGMVEPEWAKLLQVSVLGLVLGLLALRRGAGAAVAAHVSFNLIAVLFLA